MSGPKRLQSPSLALSASYGESSRRRVEAPAAAGQGLGATAMKDTLGVLLAGGAGERLSPLTRERAKPAVPFAGQYRIIDITLSNCINSNLRRVYIMTQYKRCR